jgi:hypothetical protein
VLVPTHTVNGAVISTEATGLIITVLVQLLWTPLVSIVDNANVNVLEAPASTATVCWLLAPSMSPFPAMVQL